MIPSTAPKPASVYSPPISPPESRREHQRVDIALPVTVEHAGRTLAGTSRNLSVGGMFVDVAEKVPLGASVGIRFSLPDVHRPIAVTATVRWIAGETGLGVQFDGLRAGEVWDLQRLIAPARTAL